MTEQMAIEEIQKDTCSGCYGSDEEPHNCKTCGYQMAIDALREIQQYRAIGTIEELQALKEKSAAKEPKGNDGCTCPNCNTFNEVFMKRKNTVGKDIVNCWHCGQAVLLDWE